MAEPDKRQSIIIPPVGESVSEGTLAAWLKPDGSQVHEGEDILDFESDKATLSVTSPGTGTLHHGSPAGTLVGIGAVVGFIDAAKPTGNKKQLARELAAAVKTPPVETVQAPPEKPEAKVLPSVPKLPKSATDRKDDPRPLSTLRQALARRLVESKSAAAHLSTFNEIDMGALKDIRTRLGEDFESRHGLRLGYMGFFVKACAMALEEYPDVNAYVDESTVTYHNYVDISVAVSTERGLLTPVIRNAETLGIAAIEKLIKDFATRARDKKIMPDELNGGTFTISNGGVFGSLLSTPIPNPPQTAVLGLHSIQDRAVVRDGLIIARPMMYLALTYDHRLLDGKDAIGFLKRVKDLIEDPARLLVDA